MSLTQLINLIEKVLDYLELDEKKNYEECSTEEKRGHIYPIMCKLRGEVQGWRKLYDYKNKHFRIIP